MRSRRNLVAALVAVITMVPAAGSVSAATPQNGRIAFYRWFPHQIYSMAPDGTDITRLTHSELPNWDPSWSADGSEIAFVRERPSRGTKLMVMGADGSDHTAIFLSKRSIRQPDWLSDGTHILFCLSGGRVGYRLLVAGTDGSSPALIGPTPACDPAVSPDGSKIVFTRFNENLGPRTDLWLMNADGTGLIQLTSDGHSGSAAWSPDGSRIVFTRRVRPSSGTSTQTDLFTIDANGSNRSRLTDSRRWEYAPNWSPDGSLIVFERTNYWDQYSSTELWTMASDGSNLSRLVDTVGVYESAPDWQPL